MADRAASRYVKSLLGLAIEKNALDNVHNDMLMFARVVEQNYSLALMLKSPVIAHHKKREILSKLFQSRVHPLTLGFFDIITKKNREPLLPAIAREFHNAYNEYKGIRRAVVTSAAPLDAATRAEFSDVVKKLSHMSQVELVEKVDPEMIGGFVLNVGDRQIDASIKNKLKSLKLKFSQNPYIKEL